MLLRLVLLCGALLASAAAGLAQPRSSISGYIRDATSGETLLLASVVVEGTTVGTATNTSGYYTLTGLEPGTYTFVGSYIGYDPLRQEVMLAPGENRRLDFELRPEGVSLDEVVVSAAADQEEQRTSIGVAQLSVKLVTRLPSVFEADVFRSLQTIPGIKSASDFSAGLYVRGGSPDQTMILLDRTTVYNPSHFFGFFSTFNPDALKDVQVYKGGYPAEYGGRLGSVIDIYNKDGNRERTAGRVSVGLLASRASLEGPYRRGSWMVAIRRSTLEPLLAALRRTVEGVPETFYFYDLNAKLNFDAGPRDRLSLAAYGGNDRVYVEPTEDFSLDLGYGNRTASLNWSHIYSQRLFSNFTFTGSRYFSTPVLSFAGSAFERRNEVYDWSAKGDLEFIPASGHTLQAGYWAGVITLRLRDRFDGQDGLASRIQNGYASLYAQETWRPSYPWMLKAGLRANFFSGGDYLRLEPRVSGEWRRSDAFRVQAAYGRYYQFLSLITNEAFSGLDIWLTTAEGVPPAWGDQFVLGLKTIPLRGVRVDVETYYRNMNDLFELDPRLPDAIGLDYAEIFRFGKGYAYGTEVTVEKSGGKVNGFAGYTYSNTRRFFPTFNEDRYYPPKYDRTHDLSVVANFDFARRWRATAAFSYATGQAYSSPRYRTVIDDPFQSEEGNVIIVGRVNASRLPPYHRLDAGISRLGSFFGIGSYELQAQVINVYNRRNVWFYSYEFEEDPPELEIVRQLPLLPNLSFTLSF